MATQLKSIGELTQAIRLGVQSMYSNPEDQKRELNRIADAIDITTDGLGQVITSGDASADHIEADVVISEFLGDMIAPLFSTDINTDIPGKTLARRASSEVQQT